MNCFNHSDTAGVGICQYCGKSLCRACIEFVDIKVACKATCIEQTRRQSYFAGLMQQSLEKASGAYKSYGHFCLVTGIVFFIMGLIPVLEGKNFGIAFLILGFVFFYGAISNYKTSKRIKTDEKNK